MRRILHTLLLAAFVMSVGVSSGPVHAQTTGAPNAASSTPSASNSSSSTRKSSGAMPAMPTIPRFGAQGSAGAPQRTGQGGQGTGNGISVNLGGGKLTSTIEIAMLLTLLTLAPAIFLSLTSFTRIVIVLSFMKRAMSVQELPPALIVTGFSVFLTFFVMKPVLSEVYETAWEPYSQDKIDLIEAGDRASDVMSGFLRKQTRQSDIKLMYDIARTPYPQTAKDVPFHLLVPAFVLSEIKTAFQMGFVLFLPFLVIDLVISSVLISMGMFTLPPIVISTPFKVLLFILVDGWNLVIQSAVQSFYA